MYKIHLTKGFKKDAKAPNIADTKLTMEIIDKLANGESLPSKHNDHALSGNLQCVRECHIKPDLLLIYEKFDDILQLNALRVGSHSKLFGK